MEQKMKNKVISVFLSLILSFNVAWASKLNEILLKNNTYAGSWEDPTTGMDYYTGGGIKIKFKSSSTGYSPWVKGTMANYNVGCNGMSIEGGFLALLGLDDIERQLQDAGAAFAWGILIGLAYSLPAISNVFQQIQKWARQIQGLLQNACQIGQNLAKGSTAATTIKSALEDNMISEGFGKMKDFMNDIDKQFDALDKFTNCNGEANCIKKLNTSVGKILGDIFNSSIKDTTKNGIGVTAVVSSVKKIANDKPIYKEYELKDILTTSSSVVNITEEQILHTKIALLFFGDVSLAEESRNTISSYFNTSSGELDPEKIKENGKKMLTEGLKINKAKYELLSPKVSEISKAVNILLNGSDTTLYVPNYKVGVLQIPDNNGTKKTSYVFLIKEVSDNNATNTNLEFQWDGFFKESHKEIIKLINKNADGSDSGIFSVPNVSAPADYKDYVPVLIPSILEYIQRLKKAMNTNPNLKYSVKQMVAKLAQVNSALATFGLVNEISARVKKVAYASSDQKEIFLAYITEIERIRDKIISEIKKDYKEDKDILMLLNKEVDDIENNSKKGTLR
jgi:hypothetical protein